MTLTRSVADVVFDHVIFDVESIDRMYLNMWVPRLTYGGGVQGFFVGHRGHHYASTALMDPMTKAFVAGIHGFVAAAAGAGVVRQGTQGRCRPAVLPVHAADRRVASRRNQGLSARGAWGRSQGRSLGTRHCRAPTAG